jgi:hypothetical protein
MLRSPSSLFVASGLAIASLKFESTLYRVTQQLLTSPSGPIFLYRRASTAPSVFSFYSPFYAQPGRISYYASAHRVTGEFPHSADFAFLVASAPRPASCSHSLIHQQRETPSHALLTRLRTAHVKPAGVRLRCLTYYRRDTPACRDDALLMLSSGLRGMELMP